MIAITFIFMQNDCMSENPHEITLLEALRRQRLLARLSDAELEALIPQLRLLKAEKGSIIVSKGGPGDALFMVLSGSLQVVNLNEEGREIGLNFLNSGDFFGELSVIEDAPRSASVVSITPSVLAALPRQAALQLMFKNPQVAETLMRHLCHVIRESGQQRAILALGRAHTRIYAMLMNTAKWQPGNLLTIEALPNQEALAIMANVSRETVSRALQVLRKAQVLEKDNRRLIVRRPDLLHDLASGKMQPEDLPSAQEITRSA